MRAEEIVGNVAELAEECALLLGLDPTLYRSAVLEHLRRSALRQDSGCTEEAALLALVAGAHCLSEHARQLELAAAELARERGLSDRQLAEHVGVSAYEHS